MKEESNNIQLALKISKSLKSKLDQLVILHKMTQPEVVRLGIELMYKAAHMTLDNLQSVNLSTSKQVNLPMTQSVNQEQVNLHDEVIVVTTTPKPTPHLYKELKLIIDGHEVLTPTSVKYDDSPLKKISKKNKRVKHTCDPTNWLCQEKLCVGQGE